MSTKNEIIIDPQFKSGFFLQDPDPVKDQRINFTYLDYGKKAILPSRKVWIMSQWWTPYNFKNAQFEENQDSFRYSNDSRELIINRENGELTMELDSFKEYQKRLGRSRNASSEPWSHFLLEQDFYHPLRFRKLQAFLARLDFTIDEMMEEDKENYNPEIHAAQFLWYLTIGEMKGKEEENPLEDNYIWLGIPIYDNRYPFVKASQNIDEGFSGATGTLIYTIGSESYLKEPIEFGKDYSIDLDLLPYIKKSVRYAIRKGIFSSEKNLYVNYMNIGWELPGSFRVKSRIRNLHLEAISDE